MTTEDPQSFSHQNNHEWCLLCGDRNPLSQKFRFISHTDGTVTTVIQARRYMQGYAGIMHGGVIAALLDAAMTHCLFHREIQGLTCELKVRYAHAIHVDSDVEIRAWIIKETPRLFWLKSEALVSGKVMVWAEGKFLPRNKVG